MVKRKEFILGAVVGLTFAAAATAGGVISWPTAAAGPVAGVSGRLAPSAGAAGLAFAPPQGAPLSFADIFQQVAPAVVQIDVKTRVERPRGGFIQIPGLGVIPNPNSQGEGEEDGEAPTAMGAGSGFFISADGYIVTNNHVVADAVEITVKLADARELPARVIGRDENTDLAVIKVDGTDFPFVTFEEEAQPRVGDWVVAVGNPFGLGGTATAGIISGLGRNQLDASTPYTDYIQIDAAINRGNSGGPTFDIYGRVIGVNSAILSPTGGSVGIGFAIPASIAKPITDQLRRGESITRGYVGVGIQDLSREERASLGLDARFKGAYVGTVTPGGPADTGGVQLGDIVTHVNGQEIQSSNDLTRRIGQVRPGETVRLQILRDGRRETVTIRAIVRPPESELNASGGIGQTPDAPQSAPSAGTEVVGLTVAPMTPALRRQHEVPERINGLVVTQPGRGHAQGVQPGTVIMRAGNAPVTTVAQLQAAVEAARRNNTGVFLMFWTPAGVRTGVLELPKSE